MVEQTRSRSWAQDAALAGGILLLGVIERATRAGGAIGADPTVILLHDVLWWASTAAIATAVLLRRRAPIPMLALAAVAGFIHLGSGLGIGLVDIGVVVVLHAVAVRHRRRVSLSLLLVLVVAVAAWNVAAAVTGGPIPGLPDLVPYTRPGAQLGAPAATTIARNAWLGTAGLGSMLVAAWGLGVGARSRRAYLDELRARASDLERQRDQQAELAAAAERTRISRELHDVVGHGLAIVVAQAQGAQAAIDSRPAEARRALDAIVATGRGALADMRQVLGAEGMEDPWHPQPGIGHLQALIDQVSAAGTPVTLRTLGDPVRLPPAVDRSAYRIVQEALTNTVKHAGPGASAEVTLRFAGDQLAIDIVDDGLGASATGEPGRGLRGMRERARLLGGRFDAAPRDAGGFAVRAVLPLGATDA